MTMKNSLIDLVKKVGVTLEEKRHLRNWILIDKGIDGVATSADVDAENEIVGFLAEKFPEIKAWGEEKANQITSEQIEAGERYWLIDPLDGTNNYVNGLGLYCISIALCRGKEVELGLVYNPVESSYFFAEKDKGAFYHNGKIEIALKSHLEKKASACLFSPGRLRTKREPIGIETSCLDELGKNARAIRRLGAAAWEICLTAGGFLDGFWQYGLKPWDIAAGILIAREAGLVVRDFNNNEANPLSKSLFVLPENLSP